MEDVKRGRGRPKGSGEDDSGPLMSVARALVDDPNVKATTAMKAVLRTRQDWPSSDEALIRRWQGKWRMDGEAYKQRVRDGRAEAQRQRQEREKADQARQVDRRSMWEIAADLRADGRLPRWNDGNSAWNAFAQHRESMRALPSWRADFDSLRQAGEMAAAQSGIIQALEDMKRTGPAIGWPAIGDALRAHRGVLDDPSVREAMRRYGVIGDTLQKHGEVGRALAESGAFGMIAKLQDDF